MSKWIEFADILLNTDHVVRFYLEHDSENDVAVVSARTNTESEGDGDDITHGECFDTMDEARKRLAEIKALLMGDFPRKGDK
jgi:hypothetical protein